MNEPPDAPQSDSRSHSKIVIWMVISLLVVYPLSVGPATRLAMIYQLAPDAGLKTFYAPLNFVAAHFKPANRLLEWYVGDCWGCKKFSQPVYAPDAMR